MFYTCKFIYELSKNARNPYCILMLGTVDLLVIISLDQLLLILQTLFTFFYKTIYLDGEVNST
jgi:hypothetical protein